MARENELRSNETNAASGRSGPNLALLGFGILAAAVVVFFLRNGHHTQIDFLFFEWDTTVRWAICVSILIGVLLAMLFGMFWRRARRD